MSLALGMEAPSLSLPDTDGVTHSLGGGPATLVVFTCNHCPYALAWHDRIAAVARDYPDVKVLAINPNDAERYPRDSYDAMRERVATDGGWPMPYLRDESQEVARAYGAKTTPHMYVIDAQGVLRYAGAIDDDARGSSKSPTNHVKAAVDAVLSGKAVPASTTKPYGCSVKYKAS